MQKAALFLGDLLCSHNECVTTPHFRNQHLILSKALEVTSWIMWTLKSLVSRAKAGFLFAPSCWMFSCWNSPSRLMYARFLTLSLFSLLGDNLILTGGLSLSVWGQSQSHTQHIECVVAPSVQWRGRNSSRLNGQKCWQVFCLIWTKIHV